MLTMLSTFAPTTLLGFGLVLSSVALGAPASAQVLTHHDLTAAMALALAQGALDSCAAKKYAVSIVVVDRNGETIVSVRGDDAAPYTMENARRKAYTAAAFRVSTADYAKRYADNNPAVRQQVSLPGVIASPGGLPIKFGEEVVGAAGLSGTPGVDELCVQAGIDRIAAQLR